MRSVHGVVFSPLSVRGSSNMRKTFEQFFVRFTFLCC